MSRGRVKRSHKPQSYTSRFGRVAVANARRSRLPRISVRPLDLRVLEDRRTFSPEPFPPARGFFRSATRLVAVDRPASPNVNFSRSDDPARPFFSFPAPGRSQTKARIAFSAPKAVVLCVRRHRRKEVLHAKGVAGRRGLRPPRRNQFSDVSC